MTLLIQFYKGGFPELYRVIEEGTGETYGEPVPWDEANETRKNVEDWQIACELAPDQLDRLQRRIGAKA